MTNIRTHPRFESIYRSFPPCVKKKGGKGQKVVAMIKQQNAVGGKSPAQLAKERERELREKEKLEMEKRAKADAALLAQPVQKIPPGVDPKTVYCVYHKAGFCQKGNKCKFSHDPDVGRKVEKRDIYADNREEKAKGAYLCNLSSVNCKLKAM